MGYSKKHLVTFEEPSSTRNRYIVITFDADPCVSKNLSVRLSDDDDLYFLYTTVISEEDFVTIKSQQGLLVDFVGFRQRVVDLLKQCSNEEENAVPKYMLKFTRSSDGERTGILQIIEATNFKYLTHLSLCLLAGDDETLKAYLVGQLRKLKMESKHQIESLEKTLSEVSSQLSNTEKGYNSVLKELEVLRSDYCAREARLKNEYEDKLQALIDSHAKTEAHHRDSLEKERRISAEACDSLRAEFTSKIEASYRNNQELLETRARLQESVKDLTAQMAVLETESLSAKERLTSARSQLNSVEQLCQNQSTTISRLENRINVLEQDVTSKEQLLAKTQDMLNSEREQKSKLHDELQTQLCLTEKLQSSLDKEAEEVKKANEIIKHLQTEVKSHHTKAKLRGQVAAEQERLLSAKESELQDRSNELDRVRAELRKASENIATLTDQLNQTSTELSDAQKTIKTNENIIGWLNRQISESQIGQVQQRLRSTCFVPTLPPHSTAQIMSSDSKLGLTTSPPWHPATSLNNPANMIISRLSTVSCPSNTALVTSVVPPTTKHYISHTEKLNSLSTPASTSIRTLTDCDPTGDYSIPIPGASNPMIRMDLRLTTSTSAPVTKSTPLRMDQTIRPINSSRFDLGLSSVNTGRLPSYIPSTVVSRIRAPNPKEIGDLAAPNTVVGSTRITLASSQEETERTLQQQSLTSAYFPKPVGTGAQS